MARMTAEEMRGAVTILPAENEAFDPDMENAYDQWREDLKKTQTVATLRVFRIPTDGKGDPLPNARNQAELFSAPLDLYSFEEVVNRIRQEFMRPGERSMTARLLGSKKRSDSGPGGVVFNQIVTIEKGVTDDPIPGNKDSVNELLRIVQENANRQIEMMQRLMENRQPQAEPMDLALKLTTAMTGMVAALNGGGARAGGGLKETIEMLVMAKGLMGGDSGGLKTRLEEITLLKGLAGELSGDGGNEDGDTPAGIIKAVSPLAAPIFEALAAFNKNQAEARALAREKIAARRKANPQLSPPNPKYVPDVQPQTRAVPSTVGEGNSSVDRSRHAPDGSHASESIKTTTEENVMLKMIREQLDTLVQIAAENGDPAPLAETIIGLIPEEHDEKVLEFLENPNCVDVLQSLHPKVKDYREWFERFQKAALAQFSDPDGPADGEFIPEHELTSETKARLEAAGRVQK